MTILRSNNLKEIFSMILAFGNHMNSSNKKGKVYCHKLVNYHHQDQINRINLLHSMQISITISLISVLWALCFMCC